MHALLLGVVLAQLTPGPALSVSATSVNLNPAQQQVVTVSGATAPLQATLDQRLVNATVSPDGTSVTITATQATGSDALHLVDANGTQATIAIRVAFNAGTIVPQTALTVTGNPLYPDWLISEVARWVTGITQAQAGARVTVGTPGPAPAQLAPGQSVQLSVPVQIAGNGQFFDQTGATVVTVQAVAEESFQPGVLFYDDDPEHVAQDGVLFRGTVSTTPTRLYYYHDDVADPRRLLVGLTAAPADPASVQLVAASAGPNMDVMHVGQTLTKNFMLTKARGEGIIVTLPQAQPYFLSDVPMAALQLVSGTVDLRVLSGGPVTVTVLAASAGIDPRALLDGPVLPGDGHHRTGVFAIVGFGSQSLSYAAGATDSTVVIGDADPTPPSVDTAATGHDYGDYGVSHTINLTMTNPGTSPASAYLYFKPLAGPARGAFIVDNNLVELGCVREAAPYQISAFELAPGQTYHSVVQTMTDGGSFYPAEIGLTATPPRPSAPPINAPDGCFPKPAADTQSR
ncbi:MAG TPA: hypothetical protein VIW73_08680 [Candidatus Cybelea sp.]